MGKRSIGFLIVAVFIGLLAGSVVGHILGVAFDSMGIQNNVVQKVLVDAYQYEFYPIRFNLIVMTFTFGFSINVNILSLLGIGTAWYYVKYSY